MSYYVHVSYIHNYYTFNDFSPNHFYSKGCANGSYGIDCQENCGNCHNVSQCSHINGTCLTGCHKGYRGDLCKIRE